VQSDAGSCSESSGMTSGISGVGACVLLSLESTVRAALVGAAARPAMSGSLHDTWSKLKKKKKKKKTGGRKIFTPPPPPSQTQGAK